MLGLELRESRKSTHTEPIKSPRIWKDHASVDIISCRASAVHFPDMQLNLGLARAPTSTGVTLICHDKAL